MSRLYRSMAVGRGGDAGPPAVPGLGVRMPGASFLIDDRSARDGNAAGTLAAQFFAIPGAGVEPDRVFYFTQADADGAQRGVFPAAAYPALSGYAQVPIPLPNGVLPPSSVATLAAAVLAPIYPDVEVVDDRQVNIRGPIVPGGASAGVEWADQGPAGAWGTQRVDGGGTTTFELEAATVTFGNGPVFSSGTGYLLACDIYIGPSISQRARVAVYQGGSFRAPATSTLLYDFGLTPVSAGTNGWARLYVSSDLEFPSGVPLQIVAKAENGSGTRIAFNNNDTGDFTAGLFNATDALGEDPLVPFPDVFPAGGSDVGSGYTMGVRLLFRETPIAGGGSWRRRFGVHQPASALPIDAVFTGTVLAGGNLPPQVDDMRVSAVEVLAIGDASMRLGVYQGGAIEAPGGSALIWDAGRGEAGPGLPLGRYRIQAPDGVSVDRNAVIWWALVTDGNQGPIRYSISGIGAQQANPRTNPMDWPQNTGPGNRYEYDAALPDDPDLVLPPVFTQQPGDEYDGNYPPAAIEFAVDGFELIELAP